MARDNDGASKFEAIRARATRMRIDSLQARLNSVGLLCDIAGNANPTIAAEALERARTAFDRIRQELAASDAVTKQLTPRLAEIEAELARATRRLRIVRGEEPREGHGNGGGEELAS